MGGFVRAILKNKLVRICAAILAAVLLIILILEIGSKISAAWRPWCPDYEREDISDFIFRKEFTEDEYALLYRQTGLTKLGVDRLVENNQAYRLLELQEQFFENQEVSYTSFGPYVAYMKRSGKTSERASYTVLENGDILYSPSTFFSFIRLGHSSLVVSGKYGIMMQASGYGDPVALLPSDIFFMRPAFVILRVNTDDETRDAVAEYARKNIRGLEYDLLAGIFGDKAPENLEKTHCSHMVWYAYSHFGIELDSNGGKIVTPRDILKSENVSVVQVLGVDPESLNFDRD